MGIGVDIGVEVGGGATVSAGEGIGVDVGLGGLAAAGVSVGTTVAGGASPFVHASEINRRIAPRT